MNNLSWMLYLAGVSGNVQGLMIGVSVALSLFAAICLIVWFMTFESYEAEIHGVMGKSLRYSVPILILCAALVTLVPSERTFYLIAASEMGEKAVQTETGKKAIAAVNRYLDTIGVAETTEITVKK